MTRISKVGRSAFHATAISLALIMSPAAGAQAPAPLTVTVFADRHVVRGSAFDDLASLERRVNATGAKAVRVQACGPEARLPWMAVVYRFRHLAVEPRVLYADESECLSARSVAVRVHHRQAKQDRGEDVAVHEYWQQLMP